MEMIGIYKITEIQNPNNFYVGKSNDIERRFNEHKTKTYAQSRIPFDKEIKEKGKDAFTYEVLEECSIEELSKKEKYWTDKLQATKSGNKFDGGLTDVVGSHNPKAKLTEDDIIKIRKAYAAHKKQKEVYEEYKDIITFQYFQNLWQGRSWNHIMPEVFTEENKQYYKTEQSKGGNGASAKFTDEEIILIRKRYVNENAKAIYEDYKDRVSYTSFQQILWGRYYSELPIYKKKEKKWINT
jgi:group I intron endonuclease